MNVYEMLTVDQYQEESFEVEKLNPEQRKIILKWSEEVTDLTHLSKLVEETSLLTGQYKDALKKTKLDITLMVNRVLLLAMKLEQRAKLDLLKSEVGNVYKILEKGVSINVYQNANFLKECANIERFVYSIIATEIQKTTGICIVIGDEFEVNRERVETVVGKISDAEFPFFLSNIIQRFRDAHEEKDIVFVGFLEYLERVFSLILRRSNDSLNNYRAVNAEYKREKVDTIHEGRAYEIVKLFAIEDLNTVIEDVSILLGDPGIETKDVAILRILLLDYILHHRVLASLLLPEPHNHIDWVEQYYTIKIALIGHVEEYSQGENYNEDLLSDMSSNFEMYSHILLLNLKSEMRHKIASVSAILGQFYARGEPSTTRSAAHTFEKGVLGVSQRQTEGTVSFVESVFREEVESDAESRADISNNKNELARLETNAGQLSVAQLIDSILLVVSEGTPNRIVSEVEMGQANNIKSNRNLLKKMRDGLFQFEDLIAICPLNHNLHDFLCSQSGGVLGIQPRSGVPDRSVTVRDNTIRIELCNGVRILCEVSESKANIYYVDNYH